MSAARCNRCNHGKQQTALVPTFHLVPRTTPVLEVEQYSGLSLRTWHDASRYLGIWQTLCGVERTGGRPRRIPLNISPEQAYRPFVAQGRSSFLLFWRCNHEEENRNNDNLSALHGGCGGPHQ